MNKEELYNLALNDVHKYNLLNEIFAIRNEKEKTDYYIGVEGFISLDVLNQYVNKVNENTNLKQALNEIKEICENNAIEVNTREYGNLIVTNIDDILQIIDKVGGNE